METTTVVSVFNYTQRLTHIVFPQVNKLLRLPLFMSPALPAHTQIQYNDTKENPSQAYAPISLGEPDE